MSSVELKSRAKINLSIDVLGREPNGYHLVEMIMQTINLYDIIRIKDIPHGDIIIKTDSSEIPIDSENIVYRAVNLLKNQFSIDKGVEIFIQKNIPVAAGMAGGSSNAAATLVGLNKLWKLNLSEKELQDIGFKLGADVPFCISGNAALAEGLGEKLTSIKGLPKHINILICKPELFVSTKEVYEGLNLNKIQNRPNNDLLLSHLECGDVKFVAENMANVLEEVTSKKYKEINEIKKVIMMNNALGSMMSGSGPTVFGLFENNEDASKCKDELIKKYRQVYIVNSSEKGVEISGELK